MFSKKQKGNKNASKTSNVRNIFTPQHLEGKRKGGGGNDYTMESYVHSYRKVEKIKDTQTQKCL